MLFDQPNASLREGRKNLTAWLPPLPHLIQQNLCCSSYPKVCLLVSILSEWVGLEGIHELDTAICSHAFRGIFLESLAAIRSPHLGKFGDETSDGDRDSSFKSDSASSSFFTCKSLRWLSLRRIQVENIKLGRVVKKEKFTRLVIREAMRSVDKEMELLRGIDLPLLRSLKVLQSRQGSKSYCYPHPNSTHFCLSVVVCYRLFVQAVIVRFCTWLEHAPR